MLRVGSGRTRCLQLAVGVTLANLLLSTTLVYLSSSSTSSSSHGNQERLLLSVEYPGSGEERELTPVPLSPSLSPAPSPLDVSQGVLDKYRMFKSHMFHIKGEAWAELSQKRQVCLGAQTSLDRLDQLVELSSTWSGPMSIAVFAPAQELPLAQRYLDYLRRCYRSISKQVAFHLVYPVDHPPQPSSDDLVGQSMDCSSPHSVLEALLATRPESLLEWRGSYPYPQNLLRNAAKSGCQTNYTYIPDIDMVPTPTMDLQLEQFLATPEVRECGMCAYVVPTYEIAQDSPRLPHNKTELLEMVGRKQARQFHQALYSINQKSSDLKKWEAIAQAPTLGTAYKVEKYIFKYEPLYVARAETPQFDERFIGFGMTRNTQVYEMYVAGFKFHLLNNAFTSHWGFQSLKSRPAWRAKQQEENNARFDEFAREVSARYSRDPYNMLDQLKKMNLKHVKVAYGVKKNETSSKKS